MLVTYAVISHEMLGSNDVLSGLLPFFEPLLVADDGQFFDKAKFTRDIEVNTHWRLTADIVDQIVSRMIKVRWLTRETSITDKIIYKITLPEEVHKADQKPNLEGLDTLVVEFSRFLSTLPVQPTHISTLEETKELLLQWLVESFSDNRRAMLNAAQDESEADNQAPFISHVSQSDQYLCARFTLWLTKRRPELANLLAEIAGAVILTEVILHFRNPPSTHKKKIHLQVFVDGPIIMDYLGLSGPIFRDSASYTINNLRKLGCGIGCFAHNRDEVKEILSSVLNNSGGNTGLRTIEAIQRGDISVAQVKSIFIALERKLKDAGIEVIATTLGQLKSTQSFFPDTLVSEIEQILSTPKSSMDTTENKNYDTR